MNLINKLTKIFSPAPVQESEESRLLAHAVAMVDPRLASVPNYSDILGPAIDHAIAYYERSIAAIPGPIKIAAAEHAQDNLLNALFPTQEDISAGLGRSLDVRQTLHQLAEEGHQELFALMGLRTRILQGGTTPVPADHTFRSLAPEEEAARLTLRDAAFDSLLKGFANQMSTRLRELEMMKSQKRLIGDAASNPKQLSGVDQSLEAHISRTSLELTPEVQVRALREWLYAPAVHFRLEAGAGQTLPTPGQKFLFPLMSSQDRRQWLVCFTYFSVSEAMSALARENHTHRFILI